MKRKMLNFYGGPLDGDTISSAKFCPGAEFAATFSDGIRLQFEAIYKLEKRGNIQGFFHTGYLECETK